MVDCYPVNGTCTGETFKKNAMIKSTYGFKYFNLPCFADDSGICIGALDYFPGVESKRFLEKNCNYEKTFKTIINKAKNCQILKPIFKHQYL